MFELPIYCSDEMHIHSHPIHVFASFVCSKKEKLFGGPMPFFLCFSVYPKGQNCSVGKSRFSLLVSIFWLFPPLPKTKNQKRPPPSSGDTNLQTVPACPGKRPLGYLQTDSSRPARTGQEIILAVRGQFMNEPGFIHIDKTFLDRIFKRLNTDGQPFHQSSPSGILGYAHVATYPGHGLTSRRKNRCRRSGTLASLLLPGYDLSTGERT